MFAVIEMGGKQYRVAPNQVLYVEKTGQDAGTDIDISQVLLVEKDKKVTVGSPTVPNAKVQATILEDVKAPKILGFKYKNRKNYRRKWGHRQQMQKIQIKAINA